MTNVQRAPLSVKERLLQNRVNYRLESTTTRTSSRIITNATVEMIRISDMAVGFWNKSPVRIADKNPAQ
jgi:hypothetical protein